MIAPTIFSPEESARLFADAITPKSKFPDSINYTALIAYGGETMLQDIELDEVAIPEP